MTTADDNVRDERLTVLGLSKRNRYQPADVDMLLGGSDGIVSCRSMRILPVSLGD